MEEWRQWRRGNEGGRAGVEKQMKQRERRRCKDKEEKIRPEVKRRGDKERKEDGGILERAKKEAEVVCVWRLGHCDGRYLYSAWSSRMVYLSKASRPGLGPP